MLSKKTTDGITGVLLVGLAAVLVGTQVVSPGIETRLERFADWLPTVADEQERWVAFSMVIVLSSVLALVSGGALYRAFSRYDPLLALWAALGLAALGVLLAASALGYATVYSLAQEYGNRSGAEADALLITAWAFGRFTAGAQFFVSGAAFLTITVLSLGALIVRSGAAPRWLGWLALLAGVLIALLPLSRVADVFFLAGAIGLLIALAWMLFTGVWLLARGTGGLAPAEMTNQEVPGR